MGRSLSVAVSLVILFISAGHAPAQTRVAPLYSLPEDGVWVEFDFKYRDRQNREIEGTMRISSTGKKEIQDVSYRWIEIKMEDKSIETRYGKMLLAEEPLLKGQPLEDNVLEGYHQEGKNGPILQFSGAQLTEYFSMGVSGQLTQIKDQDKISTRLGTFMCKYVESTGKGQQRPARSGSDKVKEEEKPRPQGNGERKLVYRAWLSDEVPFGVARFEIWANTGQGSSRPVFVAQAARTGKGAKSEMVVFQRVKSK